MKNVIQAMILICSATVAFMIGSKIPKLRRIGFVFGLVGQPFWFATSWMNGQWAVFALSFWYTFCHARGIWNLREKKSAVIDVGNPFMGDDRFRELMEDDSKPLTPEEIASGWHFCSEFDGLLVNSNKPGEGGFCHANCGSIPTHPSDDSPQSSKGG